MSTKRSKTATPDDGFISDNEIEGLRKKLDDDIRQMEDHMKKWKSEFFDPDAFKETSYKESRSSTTTTTSSKTTYLVPENGKKPHKSILKHWRADNLNGPLKFNVDVSRDSDNSSPKGGYNGGRVRFTFDLGRFHPKEIRVRIVNDRLQVHAKRESLSSSKSVGQEFNREVFLPPDVDPESAVSIYSKTGILIVDLRYKTPIKSGPYTSSFYKTFYDDND